jgi:integrase/recombinase XerC
MQLQDALQGFLRQLAADGRSPHTIGQYRRHCVALANWLATIGASTNVAKLTPDTLARFFGDGAAKNSCRGGPKKAVSLNAMRTSVRCLCAHLHDSGLVPMNPARMLRRARCSPPPPRALHEDEKKRLLAILEKADGPEAARDRMLVGLLLGTGVRIGSALATNIEDLDFEHGEVTLRTTKNDRPTTVIMPKAIAKSMKTFIGRRTTGPVFLTGAGRISTRHAQRRLSGWLAAAKVTGRSAHSLRHSFATSLLARTGDLRLVQLALNHSSIVSTTVYASIGKAQMRTCLGRNWFQECARLSHEGSIHIRSRILPSLDLYTCNQLQASDEYFPSNCGETGGCHSRLCPPLARAGFQGVPSSRSLVLLRSLP